MLRRTILVFLVIVATSVEEKAVRKARDSYLDALKESHATSKDSATHNVNDRESKYSPFDNQPPPSHYGPPQGYPEPHYPPANHYGPPIPHYGAPAYIPSHLAPMQEYGVPHAMLGFLDKIHLKLDIFTILKILLKLVIFKKVVGFIAILCLLLFIPKFKADKEEDDSEARALSNTKSQADEKLNTLTQYVLGAIDDYSTKTNNTTCDTIYCKTKSMFREVENKYSYQRLLEWYTAEQN